jgi:EAL domain-containing protein (putative c-di-GMP-specific phosphodiesterase class I)
MGRLTEWVVHEALEQCRAWRDAGLELRVAVNVSPSVLVRPYFAAQIQAALTRHAIPGHALVIEVTEELLMANKERTIEALLGLRGLGIRVSIDDYGTGYSSLAYLKDLPVTELKLDRSFVESMGSNARSAAIVHSTIDLAHALGLEVVAEGVEDTATLHALIVAECDLAQGYLFSHPVPAPDIGQTVERATLAASLIP